MHPMLYPLPEFESGANGKKVRKPTIKPTKCCAMHERLLRRAAPQHSSVGMKVHNGPGVLADGYDKTAMT
jgi:hypothetical protein